MKRFVPLLIAAVALAGARVARNAAAETKHDDLSTPYVPSERAAAIIALGYRELAADLLLVRMLGYFGGGDSDGKIIASQAEVITTLAPDYKRAYDIGPTAMSAAKHGVDNNVHMRAIALLERAAKQYPDAYRYPNLAGQIYLVDLQTHDPVQRRGWDERGALLLESAARKPGAPADAAMQAAILQTRFGRRQRAIDQLREILLITSDQKARERIIQNLSDLAGEDADAIAAELSEARNRFQHEWLSERPSIPPSAYIVIGPRLSSNFDLGDLAAAAALIGSESAVETIQSLDDITAP